MFLCGLDCGWRQHNCCCLPRKESALKTMTNILAVLLLAPCVANAELQSIEDAEMSELAGRDGLSVAMELRLTGSWAYFQNRDTETNSLSLSNFALNGVGTPSSTVVSCSGGLIVGACQGGQGIDTHAVDPAIVWTQIDVRNDVNGNAVLAVSLPQLTFSLGVQDLEMRRGIAGDGTAANVSRFGSVYLKNFDMSKSYFEFSGHK